MQQPYGLQHLRSFERSAQAVTDVIDEIQFRRESIMD